VLISYYLGTSPQGSLAIYLLALTKDAIRLTYGYAADLPSGYATLAHGGREVKVTLIGMEIQALLEAVIASPWGATVSSKAAEQLHVQTNNYLGNLRDFLSQERAKGKDHLCFVPHGPLHFYPLHLLGDDIGLLSRKRDGFDYLTSMGNPAALDSWDELVNYINASNDVWVQATRRMSSRLLCRLLALGLK